METVASHLGVAKDSTYRWIDHKGLTAQRIGHLWKLKPTEVDDWVRSGDTGDHESEGDSGGHEA